MGALPAVRMAWDTLDVESILNRKGFTKRGVLASSFVYAGAIKPMVSATSNVRLEEASKDPVFIAVDGGPRIDAVTLSRFYNCDRYDWSGLLEATIERLQSFEPVKARRYGCLIIDDTVIEKFGKAMQGARPLYDPVARKFVTGYVLVNLIYTRGSLFYPLGFEFSTADDNKDSDDHPKEPEETAPTKTDIALALLKSTVRHGFGQMVVHDSAYLCSKITSFLDSERIPWVSKCKSNRLVVYQDKTMRVRDVAARLSKRKFRRHKKYADIEYASVVVDLPGHGPCRLVIVRNLREDEPEGSPVEVKYLMASDPHMHGSWIVRIYKIRWKIECCHRAAKQSLGLGNYHGRKLRGLVAHTYLVALAHLLLVFVQACLPSLKEEPTGNIIDSFI